MKTKLITLFALVLCMSAFLLPMTAYAATPEDGGRLPDTTPPTVKAAISGNILRIEAADKDMGVEAVYINDKRFNYRVDGALEVGAPEVAGSGETISVYAVDFAGNKSSAVKINNPYYITPTITPAPTETAVPTETQSDQAFTPDGTGTVVDNVTEQNGKEFFSIVTDAGNTFYLIIDRQRNTENVYLLNAVTEDDLAALAEKSENKGNSAIPAVPTPVPTTPTEIETPAPTEPPKDDSGNNGMMIFIVLGVIVAGGAGYYFKIVRPKQQAANAADDEPEEDEGYDEEYDTEEDRDEPEDESGSEYEPEDE